MKLLHALALGGATVGLLAGCAQMQRPEVERVAADFATGDAAARCALLAPATLSSLESDESAACAQTLVELAPSSGQVQHSEIWGDEAQVQLADDTLFLTHTSSGWKVAAAGCTPNGDAPYECSLEGP
jgi:hypothetical protein